MTRTTLQLCGLTDSETGRLARPLPVDAVVRPQDPKIEDGAIVYDSSLCDFVEIKPGEDLLGPFLRLSDANGDDVLKYVRRYGAMMLCVHGLPATHNSIPYPGLIFDDLVAGTECDATFFAGTHVIEPVDQWKRFARTANAVINLAAALHGDKCGQSDDWRVIQELPEVFPDMLPLGVLRYEWQNLSSVLNQWAEIGNLRPRVRLRKGVPEIRLGGFLFGELGLQLMSAATRTEGFAICSECGRAYVPMRRPRKDERHYCHGCGRAAALRNAQRKRRHPSIHNPR